MSNTSSDTIDKRVRGQPLCRNRSAWVAEIKSGLPELISPTGFTTVASIDGAILPQALLGVLAPQKRSR